MSTNKKDKEEMTANFSQPRV